MAPIKAVLRSKLGKADQAKSLQELLVDKYETSSDATSVVSSLDYQASSDGDASDYEGLLRQQQEQQQIMQSWLKHTALTTLIHRPQSPAPVVAAPQPVELPMDAETQMRLLSQIFYQQMLQQSATLLEEQPLNLTCSKALKRPAPKYEAQETTDCSDCSSVKQEDSEDVFVATAPEAKRLCPDASASASSSTNPVTTTSQQRKRKRSYCLSDNEEIRSYQHSAPELFIWNGHKPMIHQFLLKLLNNASCSGLIRWLDRDNRLFKVLQPVTVARLWQFIKGNRTDNYECFARGIRHSRDIGKYFEAHEFRKKKVYKFAEKALMHETGLPRERLQKPSKPSTTSSQQARDVKLEKSQNDVGQHADVSVERDVPNVDVLAKLKSALAERIQQQQQQQLALRQISLKEEPSYEDSPLVIADCDHLSN